MSSDQPRLPAWRRLVPGALHATLGDETCCGLPITPSLRVTGVFADEFWDCDTDKPRAGSCRRCAAALRWFAREFFRDCGVQHPPTPEHRQSCRACEATEQIREPGVYVKTTAGWIRMPGGERILGVRNGLTRLLEEHPEGIVISPSRRSSRTRDGSDE